MATEIKEKSLSDVSSGMRDYFRKAEDVISKGSIEYGIELLKSIVQKVPGFIDARKALRDAERKHTEKLGAFAKFTSSFKANKFIIKGRAVLNHHPEEALNAAEDALALNVKNNAALNLLADAALAAKAPFIAIEALELISEFQPENEANLDKLADVYKSVEDGVNVLKIRQKQAAMHPGDLDYAGRLREAAAMATMEQGRWNKKDDSYADKAKNASDEDQGDKIVRAEEDVKAEIEKLKAELAAGNDSVDVKRKMAYYCMQIGRYEEAIELFNTIVKQLGTLDPAIDKAIEKAHVAIETKKLEAMRAEGASEDVLQAKAQEIYDYRLGRYEERMKLYPNDLVIRYEAAELFWEGGFVDKALEQFQLSRRNPQRRLMSIVYLGRCFAAKGQYDMAIEQFTSAVSEMSAMDKTKMFTLYYMGQTYEAMGKTKEAFDCFKQIYSANVNFMDVSEIMKKYYEQNQTQG